MDWLVVTTSALKGEHTWATLKASATLPQSSHSEHSAGQMI